MKTNSKSRSSLRGIDLSAEAERLETLAALVDGRLDDSRHAEVLAQLADDAEALDLLAEVTAITEQLEEADDEELPETLSETVSQTGYEAKPNNVIRGPWRRHTALVAAAIAAVLVLAVMVPRLFSPGLPTPQSVMAALDASKLQAEEASSLPWSPYRGRGGSEGALDFEQVGPRDSFRWGVLATDLEVALAGTDSSPRQALKPEFSRVVPFFFAPNYDILTDPETPAEDARAEHAEMQESILLSADPFQYRYGLWTRAAWWAAKSGQLDFFRGNAMRSLGALEPPESDLDEWSDLRKRVQEVQSEDDLPQLAEELEAILRRHAG